MWCRCIASQLPNLVPRGSHKRGTYRLALDFEIEAQWLEAIVFAGHEIVERVVGADALIAAVEQHRPDLAVVQATPETLTARSLGACDRSGVRTIAVTASTIERQTATSLGVIDRVDADADWQRVEQLLGAHGRGQGDELPLLQLDENGQLAASDSETSPAQAHPVQNPAGIARDASCASASVPAQPPSPRIRLQKPRTPPRKLLPISRHRNTGMRYQWFRGRREVGSSRCGGRTGHRAGQQLPSMWPPRMLSRISESCSLTPIVMVAQLARYWG